jgi:hypothetical protein
MASLGWKGLMHEDSQYGQNMQHVLTRLIQLVVVDGTHFSIFNIMVKICFFEKHRPYDFVRNHSTLKVM